MELYEIPGFPGYAVAAAGTVWSKRECTRFLASRGTYRQLSPNRMKRGHLFVWLYRDRKKCKRYVHRLVLETFVGPCPPGHECRHLDGNPGNNARSNLCWGTHSENMRDRDRHGTQNFGERNGMAKLTRVEVSEIRRRYAAGGVTQQQLADEYGVSNPNICRVLKGDAWTHPAFPDEEAT